ncbi:unnamed protein product [Adineta steineri]|uniref:Uncharacterized protein n=1 Tax=Adineta steineri TaxID=433720 RepID=A0A818U9D7_9BILA|nr:unnamed protein product [Adineta steineri]
MSNSRRPNYNNNYRGNNTRGGRNPNYRQQNPSKLLYEMKNMNHQQVSLGIFQEIIITQFTGYKSCRYMSPELIITITIS